MRWLEIMKIGCLAINLGSECRADLLKNIYLCLAALGLHCCTRAFSSYNEQGLLSSCGAWASHCGGFFCFRAQALGVWAQWLWCAGLVAL